MPDVGPRRLPAGAPPVGGRRARRRGPGIAVFAVAAYGLAFLAGLWILRRESPLFSRAGRDSAPRPPAPTRGLLLAGGGLAPVERDRYVARLAADRCDCGCGMTLRSCLESDQACTRSPELARRRLSAESAPAADTRRDVR